MEQWRQARQPDCRIHYDNNKCPLKKVTIIANLENIWVYYDGVAALEGVSIAIEEKDFIGIIGPNGGGKSTLLKVMLGLLEPSRGKVEILGLPPKKNASKIGYVAQYRSFDRNFPINVWNVVLMGRLKHAGLLRGYRKEDFQAAAEALERVEMLDLKERHISELSGGQQQRVLIARALVTEPKLLLLDEPMSNVDSAVQTGFYDLLAQLNEQMAIIMVSHDISAVSLHVKKVACLNKKLYYHGTGQLTSEDLEATYQCPVELIAHGTPHRVLKDHPR